MFTSSPSQPVVISQAKEDASKHFRPIISQSSIARRTLEQVMAAALGANFLSYPHLKACCKSCAASPHVADPVLIAGATPLGSSCSGRLSARFR